MILSTANKFLFIAVPKTGTTSVEKVLNKYDNKNAYNLDKHANVSEIKESCKINLPEYFKFCFVRNPYDRLVSIYHQWKMPFNLDDPIRKKLHRIAKDNSFSDFLKVYIKEMPGHHHKTTLLSWIEVDGKTQMDFCGRLEKFQKDFNKVCDKIKIPRETMPHLNSANGLHYMEYYDKETIKLAGELYKKDIEAFGYDLL
jgi:hypothetical protein